MNHLVLARKCRPKLFSEVVGQKLIVETLQKALEKNRVAHAFLFTGGRGVGKTTVARILAKALVCGARAVNEPCGQCGACLSVDEGRSLDVIEIDGASNTGVDDVRELRESARYQPTHASYKIFIIDEVHMLSISAFNALLKILEEPPAHVKFIFATTEPHKIPKTILSRCQRYDFRRMSVDLIKSTLSAILREQNVSIDDPGLLLIARLADGAMRDALSLTEQILSFSKPHYSESDVAHILGVTEQVTLTEAAQAILFGQVDTLFLIIKDNYERGHDATSLMEGLAETFRLLALYAHLSSKEKAELMASGCDEALYALAQGQDAADLQRLFALSLDSIDEVARSAKPRYAMEVCCLRMALRPPTKEAVTIAHCLQTLEGLIKNRPQTSEPSATSHPKEKPAAWTPPEVFPDSAPIDQRWQNAVLAIEQKMPAVGQYLRHARFLGTHRADDILWLRLEFQHSLHCDMMQDKKKNEKLLTLLQELFGQKTMLDLSLNENQPKNPEKPVTLFEQDQKQAKEAQNKLLAEVSAHPTVKKAIEVFGGDILSVKRLQKDKPQNP